jgi:hypothetical protein
VLLIIIQTRPLSIASGRGYTYTHTTPPGPIPYIHTHTIAHVITPSKYVANNRPVRAHLGLDPFGPIGPGPIWAHPFGPIEAELIWAHWARDLFGPGPFWGHRVGWGCVQYAWHKT